MGVCWNHHETASRSIAVAREGRERLRQTVEIPWSEKYNVTLKIGKFGLCSIEAFSNLNFLYKNRMKQGVSTIHSRNKIGHPTFSLELSFPRFA